MSQNYATPAYRRFRRAEALARGSATSSKDELLDLLGDIVDLLGYVTLDDDPAPEAGTRVVLADASPEGLMAHAVALVCLPPTALLDGQQAVVAAVTRHGNLYRLDQAQEPAHAWERAATWNARVVRPLEGFDATRDRIIGLYWTRRARTFRRGIEFVVVVRRGTAHRVYLCPLEQDDTRPIKVHGDHVPSWMSICSIAVPPAEDLLELIEHDGVLPSNSANAAPREKDMPKKRAVAAARHEGAWVCSYAVRQEEDDGVEGTAIACFGDGVIVAAASQTIQHLVKDGGKWRIVWEWPISRSPTSLCLLPGLAEGRARFLVGAEGGHLEVGVEVALVDLESVFRCLVQRLAAALSLSHVENWIQWAEREIGERRRHVPVVLRLVLDQALAPGVALGEEAIKRLAALFRGVADREGFAAAWPLIRAKMEQWRNDAARPAAALLLRVYEQLPHEFRDFFDLQMLSLVQGQDPVPSQRFASSSRSAVSLRSLTPRRLSLADQTAYEELCRRSRITRRSLLSQKSDLIQTVEIHAESWREPYVIEHLFPTGRARRNMLRDLPGMKGPLLVHRKGIAIVPTSPENEPLEIEPDAWFRPLQSEVVVDDAEQPGTGWLVLAADDRAKAYRMRDGRMIDQKRVDLVLEKNQRVLRITAGGADLVLVVVSNYDDESGELRLWSLGKGEVVARTSIGLTRMRELVAIPQGGDARRWYLVFDEQKTNGLATAAVEWQPETGALLWSVLSTRRIFGRVRSLAPLPDGRGVVVGTTEGHVCAMDLDESGPGLRLRWAYRCAGAVRHVTACRTGEAFEVAALSAGGDLVLLDGDGRCRWSRSLQVPPRSAAFSIATINGVSENLLCVVDVAGNVFLYRRTDARRARALAFDAALEIEEDLDPCESPSHEVAWVVRKLARGEPVAAGMLRSESARACVLRYWLDCMGNERHAAQSFQSMKEALEYPSLDEARYLASLREGEVPVAIRSRLWSFIQDGLNIAEPLPSARQLADIVAALSTGWAPELVESLLSPSTSSGAISDLRDDAWVIAASMISRSLRDSHRSLSVLHEYALELGPVAIRVAPTLVREDQVSTAEVLRNAFMAPTAPCSDEDALRIRAVGEDAKTESLDVVCRLLFVAKRRDIGWADFLGVVQFRSSGRLRDTHPVTRYARSLLKRYADCPAMYTRSLEQQRESLDTMYAVELPAPSTETGPWRDWLREVGGRFVEVARDVIEKRRKALLRMTRVRLERLRVEHIGDKLVAIRANLIPEGRDLTRAHATISVSSGVKPIAQSLSLSFDLGGRPGELAWTAVLVDGASAVRIVVHTVTEGEQAHDEVWECAIPPLQNTAATRLFDRLPLMLRALVEPIAQLERGMHILAVEDEHGPETVTRGLVQQGAFRLVQLDRAVEERATEQGELDAAGLLSMLGVASKSDGSHFIPESVVVHPCVETTHRLLADEMQGLRQELRGALERAKGRPIFWITSPRQAVRLEAALRGCAFLWPMYRAPLASGEVSAEVVAELARELRLEQVSEPLSAFGGDLRLLSAWREARVDEKGQRPKPFDFAMQSERAAAILQNELAELDLYERAGLVIAAAGTVPLTPKDLLEGMISAQEFLSTVQVGASKRLASPGRRLDVQAIRGIRLDRQSRDFFSVQGRRFSMTGTSLSKDLKPLADAVMRSPSAEQAACERMARRGLLQIHGDVVSVQEPFRRWIAVRLAQDPTGRAFVEGAGGARLFRTLSLAELSRVTENLEALCPHLTKLAISLVRRLGELWRSDKGDPDRLEEVGRSLTGYRVHFVDPSLGREGADWLDELQASLGTEKVFFTRLELDGLTHYIGFVLGPARQGALVASVPLPNKVVVTLLGPGIQGVRIESSSSVCPLPEELLKDILEARDIQIQAAFWRAVHNRVGLAAISPFQVGNYLPENSPVFVGREEETRRILEHLGRHSFLIVGSRQIGKTSLLRHVYGRVRREGQYSALWVACEGLHHGEELLPDLAKEISSLGAELPEGGLTLDTLDAALRKIQPRPVLFLNEIDGICDDDPDFISKLRGMTEGARPDLQCVFTGYNRAYRSTRILNRPFYHFTQGSIGEKVFVLGALTRPAAEALIHKLEEEPLGLRWESDATKSYAYHVILDRSHRIPILVQQACSSIVERLSKARRWEISRADVDAWLLAGAYPAWEYIQNMDLDFHGVESGVTRTVARIWMDMVLGALVARYEAQAPGVLSDERRLRESNPAEFAFSVTEAIRVLHDIVLKALDEDELGRLDRAFPVQAYENLLDELVLSVFVGPLPGGQREYQFIANIYPIELCRYLQRKKKPIVDYLLEKTQDLNEVLGGHSG